MVIVFVCFSCKEGKKDLIIPSEVESSEVKVVSVLKEKASVNNSNSLKPIKEFIEFSKLIELYDWVDDIERIEKVVGYGLSKEEVVYFEGKPFFKIPFNHTELSLRYNSNHLNDYMKEKLESLNYNLFKNTKVWSYFYRNIEDDNLIEDGVIEQWSFKDEKEAKIALYQISELGGDILYFNTQPYFTTLKNYLFIFHTRAMGFSYNQKEVFEKFIQINDIKERAITEIEINIQKLKDFKLDNQYEVSNKLTPNYLKADFDGDGLEDIVCLIKEKRSDKFGLVFFHADNTYYIIGAGKKFDNKWDDMKWLDILELDNKRTQHETIFDKQTLDIIGEKRIEIPNTGVRIREEEGSGGLLFFEEGKYKYLHQGC